MEQIEPIGRLIAAGATVKVPIVFEGTSKALVAIWTQGENVVAKIGGEDLIAGGSAQLRFLQVILDNPADQVLTITNHGKKEAGVTVMTTISTARLLTVTTPAYWSELGGTVPFSVVLTEPSGDEPITVELVEIGVGGRIRSPIAVTASGAGHWTGTVTLSTGGRFSIVAYTTGARYRLGARELSVSSGIALLGEGFTERLEDTDRDGLADELVISPTLIVTKPGSYRVNARLVDANGVEVSNAGAPVLVGVGTHSFDLEFDCAYIAQHGSPGPYSVADVVVFDEAGAFGFEDNRPSLGLTAAYRLDQFEQDIPR